MGTGMSFGGVGGVGSIAAGIMIDGGRVLAREDVRERGGDDAYGAPLAGVVDDVVAGAADVDGADDDRDLAWIP